VIAAWNAESTIGQAIASVLVQTRQDFELIVVDDGSTDATAARVGPFLADRRVRLHRQANAGPAAARNAGIELAAGRLVATLDSDDLWLPRYLEAMIEALERSPRAGFAFTRAWVLERATDRFRTRPWPPRARAASDSTRLLRALLEANFVFNAVTVRRDVLRKVGPYDPAIRASEDYELWLRIVARGYMAAYVPGPLCICSDRPGSLSHDDRRMLIGLRGTYANFLAHDAPSPELASVAQRRLNRIERELELLERAGRAPFSVAARRILADATRDWRERRARLSQPPPEVAAAFSRLGRGAPACPPTAP
jgi:glycosyltransferase involved in cell wall biosynthesis